MSIFGYINYKDADVNEDKEIPFILTDFRVKIMRRNDVMVNNNKQDIPELLYGKTGNNSIIFQTPTYAFNENYSTDFPISRYFIGNTEPAPKFNKFDRIQFCGGCLNYLRPPQDIFDEKAMNKNYARENTENYNIELLPFDKVSTSIQITIFDKKATYIHGPLSNFSNKRDAYLNIYNSVEIKFDEPQSIDFVQKCYVFMLQYMRFLIGHKDVLFDNIYIINTTLLNNKTQSKLEVFTNTKNRGGGEIEERKTIKLKWLDKHIQKFIDIYESEHAFNLDVFPDKDYDKNLITIDLVKQLCTSLEIEYIEKKVATPCDKIIKELSANAKKLVKAFKKNHTLIDKSYDSILSSVKNWSLPLAEKIMHLYTINKNIMDSFIEEKSLSPCNINDETIVRFVKIRNESTHSNHNDIKQKDTYFIYLMKVMVHVLMLKRLDFQEDNIIIIIKEIY